MTKRIALLFFAASLCFAQRSVVLTWTAPPLQVSGYNIYRATATCANTNAMIPPAVGTTKVGSVATGIVTWTDTAVVAGSTYCYFLSSTLNGLESIPSMKAEAVIIPLPPTGLTVVVPASASVRVGGQQQFAANGSAVPLWSISPQYGSISTNGLYKAPLSIQGNNLLVTVTAKSQSTDEMAQAQVWLRKR